MLLTTSRKTENRSSLTMSIGTRPMKSGCNWNMNGYRGPANYATEIRVIVNNLRREYRLSEVAARYDGGITDPLRIRVVKKRHEMIFSGCEK